MVAVRRSEIVRVKVTSVAACGCKEFTGELSEFSVRAGGVTLRWDEVVVSYYRIVIGGRGVRWLKIE